MTLGPGKYDALATLVIEQADADGVVLIVFNGSHGNGFSVQAVEGIVQMLPSVLRTLADDIEQDLQGGA